MPIGQSPANSLATGSLQSSIFAVLRFLSAQHEMGRVPSRSMFGHAEAKPRQIDSVEYRFAASEDHRGDRKVQLINQPGLQILPHRENAAADL